LIQRKKINSLTMIAAGAVGEADEMESGSNPTDAH
jgi:hypothetical protein